MYREITQCRMTGSSSLVPVLDLGSQCLSGVFPRDPDAIVTKGPLELVHCSDGGLLQLRQSYNLSEMYGDNYGYRSGLNKSMVAHLQRKATFLETLARPQSGDVVLDIGSNDATLLRSYSDVGQVLGGIDPSAKKFAKYYPPNIGLVTDFFSRGAYERLFGGRKAKIVSSIAMFYDLEAPLEFMKTVAGVLADDGIWHFEQSYLPSMLDACAYDTVCHEHLEYYGLTQIKWMTDQADLEILDVELNEVNGGSFAVTVAKRGSKYSRNVSAVEELLEGENSRGLNVSEAYGDFRNAVLQHRDRLPEVIRQLRDDGKRVLGYGASTKGNVMLQFCGLSTNDLACIAEVNPSKYGCFTPGTSIPIVSEEEAHALSPDVFLVLPWHFRGTIIEREREFLKGGGRLLFPLPKIEIVG